MQSLVVAQSPEFLGGLQGPPLCEPSDMTLHLGDLPISIFSAARNFTTMERNIAGDGTYTYFLVFNLYDNSHITFEEAGAHFVPIPALQSQWKAFIVCGC